MRAILTYHSIDASGSPISVHPDVFREQVEWLASGRVRVVGLAELMDADSDDGDGIAVTFDDGLVSFGEIAAPLLMDRGIPVTLYVVSDRLGGTNRFGNPQDDTVPKLRLLDRDQILRLAEAGVDIGAHTRTHPDLTRIDTNELCAEIEGSALEIEAMTGARPRSFAYPYGSFDHRSVERARDAFDLACSVDVGFVDAHSPRHALPRIDMYYFNRSGDLEAWGSGAFRRRLQMIRLRRTARRGLSAIGVGQ